ncbi:MAG: flagellar hook-length control protein FliK [Acidiferrobacterales bacterium]
MGADTVRATTPGSAGVSVPDHITASSGSGDPAGVVAGAMLKEMASKTAASKELLAKGVSPGALLPAAPSGAELTAASDLVRPAFVGPASGFPAAGAAAGDQSGMLQIGTPMNQTGWDQALGNSMIWMVGRQTQAAQLQINPPHLGPIEVRVAIHNNETTLTFVSAHSQVRDALQAAIPGLREMFTNSGLNLGNVDISQHSFSRDSGQPGDSPPRRDSHALPEDDAVTASAAAHIGLIDFYA